jgi:hypothetical protein
LVVTLLLSSVLVLSCGLRGYFSNSVTLNGDRFGLLLGGAVCAARREEVGAACKRLSETTVELFIVRHTSPQSPTHRY